jgi:hypothetical protein
MLSVTTMSPAHPPTLTPTTIAIIAIVVVLLFAPFIAYALVQRHRAKKKHDENVGSGLYTNAKVLKVERKGTAADLASFRVTLEVEMKRRSGAAADGTPPLVVTVRVALPLSELAQLQVGNVIPVRFAPPANVEVLLPRA